MRILIPFLCVVAIALPAKARELDVVVGWNKPPYVISQEHSGFEIDLVRAILAEMGHTLSPIYVPFGRTARLLEDSAVDIGLTQSAAHDVDDSVLSDPYIIYQNVVVTKTQRYFVINDVNDLKGKRVIGFQTAQSVLGEEFKQALALEPMYMEMARQDRQVDMLMLDHVDAIVLDRNIFNYFKFQNSGYVEEETVFHELFPISIYRAAIPNPKLRAKFNSALHRFIADGRYQLLLDEYQLDNLLHKLPKASAKL
ncbi:amino acid ABC transporter [Alteromonas sp. BL110]|uniref:substrate-binding periplasmic protein n=1 Tax=Alteromonas sp. BL110 TaxID=1714845 RepID=UPI000E51DFAB|nr:transporter substrate-binding domain-containing protein [Alteromonas sp. BL110]AXT38677.1 amino acid ABC transporter [Alteromonas sp. BL110]RKM83173.1 amino acid ABC transporter [Alteromonas sp. BL110]